MKAKEFVGIIPPLLTSFKENGDIYEEGIREIVKFTLPYVDGYYPIGTYGCGPLMSIPEREKTLEIILNEVNGKVPVVAHVGAPSTYTTIELAKHAKKAGASGVGAISPFYSPNLPEQGMFEHFKALIDAVGEEEFPVYVYNNIHYSQNRVTPNLLKKLADYGLRGCKDSSFDLVNFYQFQDAVANYGDFNLIIGTEAIFMGAFDAGATGMVCGMANIYPKIMYEMYHSYLDGNREKAMEIQRQILRIRQITKSGPTVPIMHHILKIRGINAGFSRKPLIPINEDIKKKVRKELEKLNLL
jgi:dihydrodipicolinate synthase/N-acetylneuraminate lyase